MSTTSRALPLIAAVILLVSPAFSQDIKPSAPVTLVPDDAVYKNLRSLSSAPDAFSGDFATVNNLVLKKDAGIFNMSSGAIYFLKPVEGKTVGAVFIGTGEFTLSPPVDVEKKHLEIFVGAPEVKEGFSSLILFFSDQTFDEIKGSANVQMGKSGPQADRARSLFRDKEALFRTGFRYNVTSRTLSDIYAPQRKGFFTAFIDGNKFGKLVYGIDPLGHEEVYPEQVQLMSYAEGSGGIWHSIK
ncbi:MAG: hypothetical protein H0U23_09230 [Blastocatellia bacterium]|nr:hypothetical protein [Blastocatellia bacterium]